MDTESLWLAGNGFYKTSKPFSDNLRDSCTFIKYEWFSEGDQISVKINTVSGDVVIWNNDVDFDNLRGDESNYIFFVTLPLHQRRIALSLFMGGQVQTVRIVNQNIEWIA